MVLTSNNDSPSTTSMIRDEANQPEVVDLSIEPLVSTTITVEHSSNISHNNSEELIDLDRLKALVGISKVFENVVSIFTCPISQVLMTEPKYMPDSHLYDAPYINEWFDKCKYTSPLTRQKMYPDEERPSPTATKILNVLKCEELDKVTKQDLQRLITYIQIRILNSDKPMESVSKEEVTKTIKKSIN